MRSNEQIEAAVAKFPITSYLRQFRGFEDRGRVNLRIDCPVCRGYKKLNVHRETKRAHCFKCDEGGAGLGRWNGKTNLFGLIRLLEGLDDKFALKKLFSFAGLPEPTYAPAPATFTRSIPTEAIKMSPTSGHESAQYLRRRGVAHLLNTSFVCVSGRYAGRVILPCNFLGKFSGFEAKSYCGHGQKTLYPQWFETGKAVYTTNQWDFGADFAVVTESVLDAETLGVNALGLYGSVLRDGQLAQLLDLRERGLRRLVWMLDGDALRKARVAICTKTFSWFENLAIPLNHGEDPNSIGHAEAWRLVSQARPIRDVFDAVLLQKK